MQTSLSRKFNNTNKKLENEISGFAEKLTTQNARIIELLEELINDVKKNV